MPRVVERTSAVAAPVQQVWDRVVSPEGINHELMPWMSMTMPRGAKHLTIETVPLGEPIGKAWIRLFGLVPVDYDDLSIAELEPGRRFHERSTMLSASEWQHERTLTPLGPETTEVRDRVTFTPRLPLRPLGVVLERGVTALFAHRHRRLTDHFR